jgi:hypothetical protein
MNPDFPDVETIEKETISGLAFPHDDVLNDPAERLQRHHDAERAATLGNGYQGKLDIYFQTADGITKRVQTTVGAAHEEYITLKAGATIPLRAILHFDFY